MLYTLILAQINTQVNIHYHYHKVLLAQSGDTVTAISFSHCTHTHTHTHTGISDDTDGSVRQEGPESLTKNGCDRRDEKRVVVVVVVAVDLFYRPVSRES